MMPLAVSFAEVDPTAIVLWLAAWFVTIGLHEGSHAWVAWWLGDDTAYLQGKRTFAPWKHINWNDRNSVLLTVVLPVISTLAGFLPIGVAWVPVNPNNFRHHTRDMALTALAGPGGNVLGFLLGCLVLLGGVALARAMPGNAMINLIWNFGLFMMILNILLAVINLLPIPGVDGGEVAYHFMNDPGREFYDRIRPYGLIILVVVGSFFLRPVYVHLMNFAGDTVPQWLVEHVLGG